MNIQRYLVRFMTTFAVTFIVCSAVTMVGNSIFRGIGTVDWDTSLRCAIAFGIIVPWMGTRRCRPVAG